ncbi:hypothetical protein llap_8031 [Limosa lapponica baueri]|uniref:Rna-directed dna polymerase from mobile element jockey-like n=1 Tax=Limosa lapponica baueri TaxID=1758121 RepID=A0A2I0U6H3_LIMLA|nr:hypothetical protein llap_8031 [Limosa lapponica baueri]
MMGPGTPVLEDCDRGDDKLNMFETCCSSWMQKSTGPNGFHPRVLKELANVITGPLSIIFPMVLGVWRGPSQLADVSISKKGKTTLGRKVIQRDLDGLESWEINNSMKFNKRTMLCIIYIDNLNYRDC